MRSTTILYLTKFFVQLLFYQVSISCSYEKDRRVLTCFMALTAIPVCVIFRPSIFFKAFSSGQ